SVARIRIAVVFPAPFGPRTACTVPLRAARSTPPSARVCPNVFVSPVASIASSVMLTGSPLALAAPAHRAVTGLAGRWWDNSGMANRLKAATSPYLLQHADNPVDWWPWGEEAFAEARRRDVPVLVSVGYAACHWCHVMAHESFEDPATAAIVNDN